MAMSLVLMSDYSEVGVNVADGNDGNIPDSEDGYVPGVDE